MVRSGQLEPECENADRKAAAARSGANRKSDRSPHPVGAGRCGGRGTAAAAAIGRRRNSGTTTMDGARGVGATAGGTGPRGAGGGGVPTGHAGGGGGAGGPDGGRGPDLVPLRPNGGLPRDTAVPTATEPDRRRVAGGGAEPGADAAGQDRPAASAEGGDGLVLLAGRARIPFVGCRFGERTGSLPVARGEGNSGSGGAAQSVSVAGAEPADGGRPGSAAAL